MSNQSVTLNELLRRMNLPALLQGDLVHITGVTADSRHVRPGFLFVAVAGGLHDGHRFITDAASRGAAAVAGTKIVGDLPVPYILLDDSQARLAEFAAAFWGFPARKLRVVGVTGTDGKTTTTNLIYQIMLAAGLKAGMISTVNAVFGDTVLDTGLHVTTPDAPDVQMYLAQMVASGLTHVLLETTSHGLAQHRVDACEFDIAVVTNITHEHLDYHGSYEAYRAAKGRLFFFLQQTAVKPFGNPRLAVLNRDDHSYHYLAGLVGEHFVSYGLHPDAVLRAENSAHSPSGLNFDLVLPAKRLSVHSSLTGAYNVSNCLAALGAAIYGLGIPPETAVHGIAALQGIPGRMQRIDLGQNFLAIVDFAHTPNALRAAIETARTLTAGKVIAVFGSAGLRDREKRRMMAEVSAELADISILTAEDPRTESLDGILAEMAQGALARGGVEGRTFFRVPDRGEALRFALSHAGPGDVVIACGKGHEQSMCFGEIEYPWDDATALRAALAEFLDVSGPPMPWLPTSPN